MEKHFIQSGAVVFSTSSGMAFTQAQQVQFTDVGYLCAGVLIRKQAHKGRLINNPSVADSL